ncbi:MAG: O-methyltransferase [Bacteroidales bacterium]|nr:O-methyltransferase [Bacteroidales bacterium]
MLKIDEDIWKYIIDHTTERDPLLTELDRETNLKMAFPNMLSGHYQGRLLEFISKMIQPEYILEIGTFTGYSAICMARGLKTNGKLHTIECNDEVIPFAEKFIRKAGLQDKIMIHFGDALQVIPRLNVFFDLIYIDGDKSQYCQYYELTFSKLKTGGIILVDNALWDGKVLKQSSKKDDETNGIRNLNEMIHTDQRVENIILPVRDGIMLVKKVTG